MPSIVTCKYCKQKFDRDKEDFCQYPAGKSFRYAHAKCEKDESVPKYKFGSKCYICEKCDCNKKTIPFLNSKLFVHEECLKDDNPDDKELLFRTILRLFDYTMVPSNIIKTINKMVESYGYTYSGIQKTLEYWYDLNKNDISKANGNINIVPYVYEKAKQYYKAIWIAERANKNIDIPSAEQIKTTEIKIKHQERQEKRKSKFSFLDKEE